MSHCVIASCQATDPRFSAGAYACNECQKHLVRMLGDIEHYLDIVTPYRMHRPSERRSPGYRSVSPANDTVIAMFDRRSSYEVRDPVEPLINEVTSWARIVLDEIDDSTTPETLSEAVRLLRTHTGAIAREAWCDALHSEMSDVHAQLRSAVGDQPPKPIARCYDMTDGEPCEGPVYWRLGPSDEARCTRCLRIYSGLDLVRLQAAQEAS